MNHQWKVVPLSEGQLKDVREEDILEGGLFRMCETYRGGGGYDMFLAISAKRTGYEHHRQFIVQLFGCNLDCPYCYVTREGVWGPWTAVPTSELVESFMRAQVHAGATVFHLMGGAPALQLDHWPELIQALWQKAPYPWIFHSDLMLTERDYDPRVLQQLMTPRALFAVDVKGLTDEEHLKNTRKPWLQERFWFNLNKLEALRVPFYFTFTNIADRRPLWDWYDKYWPGLKHRRQGESFTIELIQYDALAYVDRVPWGGQKMKDQKYGASDTDLPLL